VPYGSTPYPPSGRSEQPLYEFMLEITGVSEGAEIIGEIGSDIACTTEVKNAPISKNKIDKMKYVLEMSK